MKRLSKTLLCAALAMGLVVPCGFAEAKKGRSKGQSKAKKKSGKGNKGNKRSRGDKTAPEPDRFFKKGASLYQAGKFKAASVQFEKAFELKEDAQVLFAWAQSVNKSGDCRRAVELYDRLLLLDLPKAQVTAIEEVRSECEDKIGAEEQAAAAKAIEPEPQPEPADSEPESPFDGSESADSSKSVSDDVTVDTSTGGDSWYSDPVAGSLLAVGLVGVGVGVVFYVNGVSADDAADGATSYGDFQTNLDRAKERGTIGIVATATGAALIGTAIILYALHKDGGDEAVAVSPWVGSKSGGLAVSWSR